MASYRYCYSFSLIDQVEDVLLKLTRDFDQEFVLRRVENGRLRIGLADSDVFPHFRHNPKAYLAVDQYESLDEIVSACVLSSYLPGLTGPFLKISHLSNGAAGRASRHLMKMTERGAVKRSDGSPVQPFETAGQEIRFWDGGLVNGFPVLGADTCLITPFTGNFSNPSISPCHVSPNGFFRKTATISEPLFIAINDRAKLHLSRKNVHAARCVALSSDDHVLESWFDLGYNEAQRFLNERNLETVYSAPTGMIKQTATSTDTLV